MARASLVGPLVVMDIRLNRKCDGISDPWNSLCLCDGASDSGCTRACRTCQTVGLSA